MTRLTIALASSLALALAACSAGDADEDSGVEIVAVSNTASLVDVAKRDSELSRLSEAIGAAGLEQALSDEGPFTIFAPTNAAFDAMGDQTGDAGALGSILQYHVVEGTVDAGSLVTAIEEAGEGGHTITTLGGGELTATSQDGAIILTDATGGTASVSAVDVEAANGLIHVIDSVLMPR